MASRESFERDLSRLQDNVLILASMVDRAIGESVQALRHLDLVQADAIIRDDKVINLKRYAVEEEAVTLIATQQPVARDLRIIVAVLHIVGELERMGDYGAGIARIVQLHEGKELLKPLIDLPRMADLDRSMLREALDAFVNRDVDLARQIVRQDDDVDQLYRQIYNELLTFMIKDPRTIDRATWLLWAAHNLERIADRVTNICERVEYLVTGQVAQSNVS